MVAAAEATSAAAASEQEPVSEVDGRRISLFACPMGCFGVCGHEDAVLHDLAVKALMT